jgi:hypothetical protein
MDTQGLGATAGVRQTDSCDEMAAREVFDVCRERYRCLSE